MINMVDASGATAYTYNSVGLVTLEDGPWDNDAVSFSYSNRLRSEMVVENGNGVPSSTFAYGYDSMKRLASVSSPAGTFAYSYRAQPLALVARITLPNNAYITNAYDSVARLSDTYLKNSSGTVLDSSSYHRTNGSPRIVQITRGTMEVKCSTNMIRPTN